SSNPSNEAAITVDRPRWPQTPRSLKSPAPAGPLSVEGAPVLSSLDGDPVLSSLEGAPVLSPPLVDGDPPLPAEVSAALPPGPALLPLPGFCGCCSSD